jgi:hypothetical protein
LGLRLIVLARRLGLRAALPGPPWLLPHPDLSHAVFADVSPPTSIAEVRVLRWWHGFVAGARRIPGSVVRAWC